LREQVLAQPVAQERFVAKRAETLKEMCLFELRHEQAVSRVELAGRPEVTQGAVSMLERAEDVRVSTLREYLEALRARLELVAVFDDEDRRVPVRLSQKESEPAA
jgi:hypothetical protein